MVGPTALVPKPSVSRLKRLFARRIGRPNPAQRILGVLIGLALLFPAALTAQGPADGPIQQVGFGGQGGVVSRHLHPYPVTSYNAGCCPETTYEYLPEDRYGNGSEHLAAIGGTVRSAWYRMEYLNWTIEAYGDQPLGARRLSGAEGGPFDAIDPVTQINVGFASQPDARAFDSNKNNGLRFSLGIPTEVGDLEASVFILDQADSSVRQNPVRRFDLAGNPLDNSVPNFFAATLLTVSGALSDSTMILYDQGYQASLKTDVFGTEVNFVLNPVTPNQPLLIRPLVGFQYVNYRENFLIAGADEQDAMDPMDPLATIILNHRIDARSRNKVYAPQIGFRAEFIHEWFTIGVTPKFLLGFNRRHDQLRTSQILTQLDSSFQQEDATEFSPGFDLKVDARVHVNEHFSLFASYQLYVLSNISRPLGNINYDTTAGTVSNINLNTLKQHDVWFDGVTVGGELRFH